MHFSSMDSRTAFSDSNDLISNSSSISFSAAVADAADDEALRRLSDNLDAIFEPSDAISDSFSDAIIAVSGGREVAVHRCILSARSPFFRSEFDGKAVESERVVRLELGDLAKDFEVGFESLLAVLGYLYSGKLRSLPKGVCVCVDDECSHVACRPAVEFLVEVLYLSHTFQAAELVALYQRHLLEILDKVVSDDLLVVLSVASMCRNTCETLLGRCIDLVVNSDVDVTTLDKSLPEHIVKQIIYARKEFSLTGHGHIDFPDKHVKRIHRALECDDVELVQMLLKEGHTTLDDAYALHYAVAYCDAKTTTELLELGLANINLRNRRGYTVLHVAAMRKEPRIIVYLLTKGAQPTDLTLDGRKALQIAKRLTKVVDFYRSTEEGRDSPKDRLCIEILEQAERREPPVAERSLSLANEGNDLRLELLYLENRVALARVLFPMEAKVAMDIAQVDGTCEFTLSKNIADAQRNSVYLNEARFILKEEHLQRIKALSRTVEVGKCFFPRCSEVLNKIMDAEDLSQLANIENYTPEEERRKKKRFNELQEALSKAFTEDKKELDRSAFSSSRPYAMGKPRGKFKFNLKG